ncbi:MAG: hypothetical protein KF774_12955 [Planctomyces sp.]|nr:hypothetical protein [Planctomyces sp.]
MVLTLGAASRADATCGDYLLHSGMTEADAAEVVAAAHASGAATPQPDQRRPCRGPGCRNQPSAPAVPPSSPELQRGHDPLLAAFGNPELPLTGPVRDRERESGMHARDGYLPAILRPPTA